MKWQPSLERESHYTFRLSTCDSPFIYFLFLSSHTFTHFGPSAYVDTPTWRPEHAGRTAAHEHGGPNRIFTAPWVVSIATDDPWDYLWSVHNASTIPVRT